MKSRLTEIREWLFYDNRVSKACIALLSMSLGLIFILLGRNRSGAEALAKTHRADLSTTISRWIAILFRNALAGKPGTISAGIRQAIRDYPASILPTGSTAPFHANPERLLDGCISVLKSPSENERGVIYLYYSYIYPLFVKFFETERIVEKYYVVTEPSWSGYCDLNILSLSHLPPPVFVGSIEPRDTELIASLQRGFIPVAVSGNTWIDTRVFKPLPDIAKDIDIICIASWSGYKRHWAIFRALRTLKKRGRSLRVALVGYPMEMTMQDIRALAAEYDVEDFIELHERLPAAEVNRLLNRSKVNLLWSRREGVNRAIIEGMAANVPCIVREGFNYGHHYPYINEHTGRFSTEADLPDCLDEMINRFSSFSPRQWVVSRMTPEYSAQVLDTAVRDIALAKGEKWTVGTAPKVNALDGLTYFHATDRARFDDDYRFLESCIRSQ